jgi:AmmeMemoRadiSam system protein B
MLWDPSFKPRLRPLEAFPLPPGDGAEVGLRDPGGLSDIVLTLSHAALRLMAMMDGANTCEDIRRKFHLTFGQTVSIDTLQSMLEHLNRAHFLEGPAFEAYYESLYDEYRSQPARRMRGAEAMGIIDDSGELFDRMLAQIEPAALTGLVAGLIAPHLDYARGAPCYAAAYAALRDRPAPDRVVILGTNHFGRSTSVVATASHFATPLGTTHNDVAFLERVESVLGHLRKFEFDHAREHSIELQVAWLQHLFGAESFEMVPFLCPDPCGPTGTAPFDGNGVDLSDFAATLSELIAEDSRDTLLVASADFSHVGAAFGDRRRLDAAYLDEVRRRDESALGKLEAGDPGAFVQYLAESGNPTRVCSAGCVFALATMLRETNARVLAYHQAVDQASQTGVTCAAVAFT